MSDPTIARCWDKQWKYVPKDATNLAETFKRIRREQAKQQQAAKVTPIKARSAK